ncbi:hypothetical protein MTBBW1_720014 [Desulfamplus magnetovallimortis]|uniref:HTH tetR-type domain-containing protein n=1 Tax=Desulfamplus magnetovallimortis TaxID=1246637 RepID=A0A1W1HIT9_9BACT|nr:TetR/AcrR family transcriptional regulator [Desulfamplus magnetovallimortis]SLM32437.1 hypothetical protein MTBBW1_720014 [Desulfamplus magnetovallimortis]
MNKTMKTSQELLESSSLKKMEQSDRGSVSNKNETLNKKDAKRIATRKKIVDAATHLFARLGYHKTTIQDIAYHIGMTTGAVFHHFGSKKDILDEVVLQLNANLEQYIEFLDKEHRDYNEMVKGLVDIFVSRYHSDPDSIIGLTSLAAEFSGIREPIIINIQSAYDRFVDAFENALDGFSSNTPNRAAGVCFIAALQGVAIQALLRGGEVKIEELVDGFISLTTGKFWQSS